MRPLVWTFVIWKGKPMLSASKTDLSWETPSDQNPYEGFSICLCRDGHLELDCDERYREDRDSTMVTVKIPAEEVPDFLVALQTWIEQLSMERQETP